MEKLGRKREQRHDDINEVNGREREREQPKLGREEGISFSFPFFLYMHFEANPKI